MAGFHMHYILFKARVQSMKTDKELDFKIVGTEYLRVDSFGMFKCREN